MPSLNNPNYPRTHRNLSLALQLDSPGICDSLRTDETGIETSLTPLMSRIRHRIRRYPCKTPLHHSRGTEQTLLCCRTSDIVSAFQLSLPPSMTFLHHALHRYPAMLTLCNSSLLGFLFRISVTFSVIYSHLSHIHGLCLDLPCLLYDITQCIAYLTKPTS